MASTNIDAIFGQIQKDFIEISKQAAREAAKKAQKDVVEKADQFIFEYYGEYAPRRYTRLMELYKLVEPIYEESESANGITIEFGVKYNPSNIAGIHKSYSKYRQGGSRWIPRNSGEFNADKSDNGIPEAEWITGKFFEGVHPSGLIGDDSGFKGDSPDDKMQEFFDLELERNIGAYIDEAMWRAVSAYF